MVGGGEILDRLLVKLIEDDVINNVSLLVLFESDATFNGLLVVLFEYGVTIDES